MGETEICGGNPENLSEMEAQRSFWLVGATSDDPPSNLKRCLRCLDKWRRGQTLMSIAVNCAAIAVSPSADSARGFYGPLCK
jgi:hypothetical protein